MNGGAMKTLLGALALLVGLSFMGVSTAVASDQPTTVTAKDGDGDKDGKNSRHHRKHHRKHHHKRHHKHEETKPTDEKK
jgi:Spy/CpxP family protein refolding chaperone